MATEDDEAAIARQVRAAVESGPAPDRRRLARIAQGLPLRPVHRAKAWLLAAGLAAAAAAGAGYWLTTGSGAGPGAGAKDAGNEAAAATGDRDAPPPARQGADAPRRDPEDPVIYQR